MRRMQGVAAPPLFAGVVVLFGQATKRSSAERVVNTELMLGAANPSSSTTVAMNAAALLVFGSVTVYLAARGRISYFVPALLIGGGASNLLDRLTSPGVYDFINTG